MGSWYSVTKVIRGVAYNYKQTSWRENGKVRTKCRCLGRADALNRPKTAEAPENAPAVRNTTVVTEATPVARTDDRQPLMAALHKIRDRIEIDRYAIELIDDLLRDIDAITLPSLVTALTKIAEEMIERYAQEGILELLAQAKAALAEQLPPAPETEKGIAR